MEKMMKSIRATQELQIKQRKQDRREKRLEKYKDEMYSLGNIFSRAESPDSPLYWYRQLILGIFKIGDPEERQSLISNLLGRKTVITQTFDITYIWVRAQLSSLWNIIIGALDVSTKGYKLLWNGVLTFVPFLNTLTGNDLNKLKKQTQELFVSLMYTGIAILTIMAQLYLVYYVLVVFDYVTGSEMSRYANRWMIDYFVFLKHSFKDAANLFARVFCYTVGWGEHGKKMGFTEGLLYGKDKKLFNTCRIVIDYVYDAMTNIITYLTEQEEYKEMFAFANKTFDFIKQAIIAANNFLKKTAEVVAKTTVSVVNTGIALGTGAAKAGLLTYQKVMGTDVQKQIAGSYTEIFDGVKKTLIGSWGWVNPMGYLPGPSDEIIDQIDSAVTDVLAKGNLRPYSVLTVCSILGISKATFDRLQNKKLVKYANENPLHQFEVLRVACLADKELSMRKVAKVEPGATLRF